MTSPNDRESAAELVQRIEHNLVNPSKVDEAGRPKRDRPPGFADALMSEQAVPDESAARLNSGDWQIIRKALEHYAACKSG